MPTRALTFLALALPLINAIGSPLVANPVKRSMDEASPFNAAEAGLEKRQAQYNFCGQGMFYEASTMRFIVSDRPSSN